MTGVPAGRTPVIVLDQLGYQVYRDVDGQPFLSAEDYEVRLVTDLNRIGQAAGHELAAVVGVPRSDIDQSLAAVRFLHEYGGRPARGLVAVTENLLLPAARLRDELGIPGPTEADTLLFRDKVDMKRHLIERGVRTPEFAPFGLAEAERLLHRYGRVVVKPRRGEGSADVSFLNSRQDLARWASEHQHDAAAFEVEEFVPGELFHIDSVVRAGAVLAATVGRSIEPTTSYLRLRSFRDVAVGPGPELDRLLAFNAEVLSCHPGFSGVTHHELFLCADEVCFCEIAARPGGGGVVASFQHRTGALLDEMCLRGQLGLPIPDLPEPSASLTGFAHVYANPGRLLADFELPPAPWLIEARIRYRAGDLMPRPASWGQAAVTVTVSGATEAEVTARLDELVELVQRQLRVDC